MGMKKMLAIVAAAALVAVAAPAFAANPFSDVPLNHWAYDAVENLAAKGILDGYPDNTFRGKKAMTRYEIATMVARAMANQNLGNEDIEQLKSLVVEFGPELEALGVKVDSFDSRLSALEKGIGGWKISGQMRFDYKSFDYDGREEDIKANDTGNKRTGFDMDRGRLFLHKDLAQGVSFDARWHRDNIDRYWMTAKDFMGVEGLQVRLGTFNVDWDSDDHMKGPYFSSDSWMTDMQYKGAELSYRTGSLELVALAASDTSGHNTEGTGGGVYYENSSDDIYAGRVKAYFGDRAWLSLNVLGQSKDDQEADEGTSDAGDISYVTYWANLGVTVAPGIDIRGSYFLQDWEEDTAFTLNDGSVEDSPSAYRVILVMDQSVLKFTSLWAQYSHFDGGFRLDCMDYTFNNHGNRMYDIYDANSSNTFLTDHDTFYAYLRQQWTPKFRTFEEVQYADADEAADATRWVVGVGYQYSPALYFELAYSMQDGHCNQAKDDGGYEDNIIRFRTLFNF